MDITPFTNKINLFGGLLVSLLSFVFGQHWFLFAAYLILNGLDFLTRWITARILHEEKSSACLVGIVKKLGYWVMIALGFLMGAVFMEIGFIIGVNLEITTYIGWFTLAALTVNEVRSILENLVEGYGDKVPKVLVKGLSVANKAIEDAIKNDDDNGESED